MRALLAAVAVVGLLAMPSWARAHCDALDGPVVTAARAALDSKSVDKVLVWVQPAGEPEVRAAFQHTLAVRALGKQAQELADTWFFETLVRVHRAGEGFAFTGLKPAGQDLGPAIPAADKALATGNVAALDGLLTKEVRQGLKDRFQHALEAKKKASGAGVEAGREAVHAYVEYLHYAEGVYESAARKAAHAEPKAAAPHAEHAVQAECSKHAEHSQRPD